MVGLKLKSIGEVQTYIGTLWNEESTKAYNAGDFQLIPSNTKVNSKLMAHFHTFFYPEINDSGDISARIKKFVSRLKDSKVLPIQQPITDYSGFVACSMLNFNCRLLTRYSTYSDSHTCRLDILALLKDPR